MTPDGTLGTIPIRNPVVDKFNRIVIDLFVSKGGIELIPDGSIPLRHASSTGNGRGCSPGSLDLVFSLVRWNEESEKPVSHLSRTRNSENHHDGFEERRNA